MMQRSLQAEPLLLLESLSALQIGIHARHPQELACSRRAPQRAAPSQGFERKRLSEPARQRGAPRR
eukprot:6208884-Pleurochrysis_carterae.AAC.1